jgi:hypothetical protein
LKKGNTETVAFAKAGREQNNFLPLKSIYEKRLIVTSLITVIAGFTFTTTSVTNDPNEIQPGDKQKFTAIRKKQPPFFEKCRGPCHSCHHQALTTINLSMAKEKGFVGR